MFINKARNDSGTKVVDRIPQQPPVIAPITGEISRPLWSVMIPAYNCSIYLMETLESVLQQDPGGEHMQIEVVDDASTDADVKSIVQTIGQGRIMYYRQPFNVGSLRNFETCIKRARGHLIHILHGDDKVKEGYYEKIEKLFEKFPQAGAAFCKHSIIDGNGFAISTSPNLTERDGILQNWLNSIAKIQLVQYAAISVRRTVYEDVGAFYAVTYGEDWEMWTRIAAKYPTAYTPLNLAEYRLHFNSISGASYRRAKNIKDLSVVIKIINRYLKEPDRKIMLKETRKSVAYDSLEFARQYIWPGTRNWKIIAWQVFGSLRLYRDLQLIKQSWRLLYYVIRSKRLPAPEKIQGGKK
jgi:glycosyltransferase involved in cell wall biosynthesis